MTMEWKIDPSPVEYMAAVTAMESRVAGILSGSAPEQVWLLEHPPLYTGGTGAKAADLIDARFPVYESGRGGQYTYHGPGQRIAYVMLDLDERGAKDVRLYVQSLERWLIATLAHLGVDAFTREGRIGVWVHDANGSEMKIAALGIRMRRWVTYHGISINVNPDLSHYSGIIPCGIGQYGVTSLKTLGVDANMSDVDEALRSEFGNFFQN
jgi:lipoyl(octanoyl) transferase